MSITKNRRPAIHKFLPKTTTVIHPSHETAGKFILILGQIVLVSREMNCIMLIMMNLHTTTFVLFSLFFCLSFVYFVLFASTKCFKSCVYFWCCSHWECIQMFFLFSFRKMKMFAVKEITHMMFVCLVHAWFLSNIWGNILTCISRRIIESDKLHFWNDLFLWCPLFLFCFGSHTILVGCICKQHICISMYEMYIYFVASLTLRFRKLCILTYSHKLYIFI